jgi:hypothetical protein
MVQGNDRHHLISRPDAIPDLGLAFCQIARNGCTNALPREFNGGIDVFAFGDLYVGMIYPGGAADLRLRRVEIGSGRLQIGFEGRLLVLGIFQHLLGHGATRKRLLVADDIVAHLVKQSRSRENPLARLLAGREKSADRAHCARQLALGLSKSRYGPLRVETDKQITLCDVLGFLVINLGDIARRVGIAYC